jgi:predicted homoserine dehydrogenase-like protein
MGVDKLLAERATHGDPVRVAMAGCGFMGRGLVNIGTPPDLMANV